MSSRPMPAGMLWLFRAVGLSIIVLGLWLSGGEELTCSGSPAAECRLQTSRWLGASLADDISYSGITKVETILERQAGQGADDAWYVGLLAYEREVGRVFASRERAQAARSQLTAWIEGGSRGESRVSWSSWPSGIGLLSFGVVWLVAVTVMERAKR